jgi:hypothetical protein
MIVQRDSARGLRWRLEELQTTSPRRHIQIATGRVSGCGHPWTPGARADFRTCDQSVDSVQTRSTALATQLDAPMWIECDAGCCVLVK